MGHLLAKLLVTAASILLDVYCGVGLFSKFFAAKSSRVIGIESSASACEDFAFNLDAFENVELYEGLAEEVALPFFAAEGEAVVGATNDLGANVSRHFAASGRGASVPARRKKRDY